jgi:ABC-type sugar transport system permease subunit
MSDAEPVSTSTNNVGALLREMRSARGEKVKSNPFGYLFIAPALVLYAIFNVWPMIRGFLMAFTDYRFIYPDSKWLFNGIANFAELFEDKVFWESLGLSVRYTLIVLPSAIVFALLVALLINRVKNGSGFYRWAAYLPVILPTAVTFLLWGQFYGDKFGFINTNLRALGVVRPPNWLGQVQYALTSVAMVDVWRGFGFFTILFLIGLYNINQELFEAAAIDGANTWQQFWQITLPLLRPTFLLILVLNAGINPAAEQILILTGGAPQNATRTLGFYNFQVAFNFGDLRMGYAASMSLILWVVTALLTAFWFRVLRER